MNNPNLAVGGNGIGGTDNGQKKSLLDKLTNLSGAKQPEEPIDYSKLDNAKTKSMVESKRAAAAEELQRLQALEQQRIAQLKMQENVATAKKTGVYITVTAICIVLLICLVFFFLSLTKYLRRSDGEVVIGDKPGTNETVMIGGYSCKKSDCSEMLVMSDGEILIKDEGYLIYGEDDKESFVLALDGDYAEFEEFFWGDKQYLLAKNAEGLGSIFSITENKRITDEIYEAVVADSSDPAYSGLDWIVGKLIIMKRSGSFRLVDIENGSEKVAGAKGVFATRSGYYIAKEENGVLRVYNSSKNQVLLAENGEQLYERDGFLIIAKNDYFEIIKNDGEQVRSEECPFYDELNSRERNELAGYLNSNGAYLHIQN